MAVGAAAQILAVTGGLFSAGIVGHLGRAVMACCDVGRRQRERARWLPARLVRHSPADSRPAACHAGLRGTIAAAGAAWPAGRCQTGNSCTSGRWAGQ